jgi:hypothetical protein
MRRALNLGVYSRSRLGEKENRSLIEGSAVRSPLLYAAAAVISFVGSVRAEADSEVQCTITLEACGDLEQKLSPLAKTKEGVCMKADLATIGKRPQGVYYAAVVWIGISVSGDTVVFGKGEAKAGVALQCSWNLDKPKPEQQIASLKASIPQLLKNQQFQKQFPGIKKIDVSRLRTIDIADTKCAKALAEFVKKN